MNTNLKKILTILIVILILALVGLLIYNLFFKKAPEEGEEGGPGQLPPTGEGEFIPEEEEGEIVPSPELKVRAISKEKVLAPTLSVDKTRVVYYSQNNGNVWQSAFDGSKLVKTSSAVLDNLAKIIWSPDKSKVISIYQDLQGNITKYLYDYETGKSSFLSNYLQEITWSPNSNKIVYQYFAQHTEENHIDIANPNGSNAQKVADIPMNDINLEWLDSEIAVSHKPSGLANSSLFLFDYVTGEKTAEVLQELYGLSIKWSPQKDKILYSKTNESGKNITLNIISRDGTAEMNTAIITLAEKCAWSQDNRTIYCAVPKNLSEAEILPDDFYKGSFVGDDEFIKMNLETGEKSVILEPWEREEGEKYDATNLFLSPLEEYLFFVNKRDGLLYSIEL